MKYSLWSHKKLRMSEKLGWFRIIERRICRELRQVKRGRSDDYEIRFRGKRDWTS